MEINDIFETKAFESKAFESKAFESQGRLSAGCCGDAFGNDAHLRRLQGGE